MIDFGPYMRGNFPSSCSISFHSSSDNGGICERDVSCSMTALWTDWMGECDFVPDNDAVVSALSLRMDDHVVSIPTPASMPFWQLMESIRPVV